MVTLHRVSEKIVVVIEVPSIFDQLEFSVQGDEIYLVKDASIIWGHIVSVKE